MAITINGSTGVQLDDNDKQEFGNSADLKIFHDGSHSYIEDSGTGDIVLKSDTTRIINAAGTENIARFLENGACELYFDSLKKLSTVSTGVKIENAGNNRVLKLDHTDGDYCYITFMDDDTSDDGQVRVGALNNDLLFLAGGSERLRIDSSGNVGIGETSPTGGKLHIAHGNEFGLYTSGPYNFQAKFESTDAEAGIVIEDSNSTTNANRIGVITNDMAFTTNDSERLRILSGGQVLIGKTTNSQTTGQGIILHANANISYAGDGSGDHDFAEFYRGTSGSYSRVGYIRTSGSSTTYSTSSDYRLKENEVAISDGITRLKLLKPYKFNFKVLPDTKVDGFFAHEVTPAVPEAITGEKDGTEMQGIDQSKLVPLLTAALQEAITKIETLETKVAALEAA